MSGMTEIFLGIIIVGIIMTVKVVMDGLREITLLNERIAGFRASTEHCQVQLIAQDHDNEEIELAMKDIKEEVDKLSAQEKEMNNEITSLRTDLDGNKQDT